MLGLAEGTTDPGEIRRAYAAKVRESPPDRDPEGFRLIREAYESLRDGEFGSAEEDQLDDADVDPEPVEPPAWKTDRKTRPPADGSAPTPPPPDRETRRFDPEALCRAELAAVERAAALAPGEDRSAALRKALRALANRAHQDVRLVPLWSAAFLREVWQARPPLRPARFVQVGDVVLDLREGDGEVASHVIDDLLQVWDYDGLETLARALHEFGREPRYRVEQVELKLATAIALVQPALARALADRAFRQRARAALDGNDWDEFDRRIAAAKGLSKVARTVVRYLAALVAGRPWDQETSRYPAREALRVVARLPADGALRALLLERAPEFVESAGEAPASGWGCGKTVAIFILVTFLIRVCVRVSDDKRPNTRPDTERILRDTERILRDIEEKRKRRLQPFPPSPAPPPGR